MQPHAHQAFVIQFCGEEYGSIPLVQSPHLALMRANTESKHAIGKKAHALFAVSEAMRRITLPGPAHKLWSSPLSRHDFCRMCDQAVHHLLEQKQRWQAW